MDKQKLLNLLENNAKLTLEKLAEKLDATVEEVADQIDTFEKDKVI
ncbi:MAG: Lrp/AsnC family transcriptional regulator, partial [Clostridia bacterium]|nr:Lrp/AsnC family transcriptional regulator [Clostridia bacterium]